MKKMLLMTMFLFTMQKSGARPPFSPLCCVTLSIPEACKLADIVFTGKALRVKEINTDSRDSCWATWETTIKIDQIFKGTSGDTVVIYSDNSTVGFRFGEGKRYIVFGSFCQNTRRDPYHTDQCAKTQEYDQKVVDEINGLH